MMEFPQEVIEQIFSLSLGLMLELLVLAMVFLEMCAVCNTHKTFSMSLMSELNRFLDNRSWVTLNLVKT